METLALLAALFASMVQSPAESARAIDNAMAVAAATYTEGCVPFGGLEPEASCVATMRIALTMGYWEGRGKSSPDGWNDGGAACGVMQVHGPRYATCKAVRASLLLGYREGIARIRDDLQACSKGKTAYTGVDVRRALGRYAAGKCGAWSGEAGRRYSLSGAP